MRIENLALKPIYFDSILRGTKTVEYRDMTPYYIGKFVDRSKYPNMTDKEIIEKIRREGKASFLPLDALRFFSLDQTMTVGVKDISVYKGHTTFAIKLGSILDI